MSSAWDRTLRILRDRLWVAPAAAGLFAVGVAAAALWIGRAFETEVDIAIGEDALVALLSVFAAGMLTVATFAISAIASSAVAVANSTTPRASRYVLSDRTGQFVVSSVIAAFVYSVVGILALYAFEYGSLGRFILFVGLILIIATVLVAFVRWIDHVLKLGRQSTILGRLLDVARDSLTPDTVGTFGARRWDGIAPAGARPVVAATIGFVVAIDVAAIQAVAAEHGLTVTIATRPGEVVEPTTPVAYVRPAARADDAVAALILTAIETGTSREHDYDVRFNLLNLTETADRALSPAVNDPGTAINVLFLQLCVFARWAELVSGSEVGEIRFDRVEIPPLRARELVADAFVPIARDGAGMVEVGVRLAKTLQALDGMGVPELSAAAREMSAIALDLAENALVSDAHRTRLAALALTDESSAGRGRASPA